MRILETERLSTELDNLNIEIFRANVEISLLDKMEEDYNKQVSDLSRSWNEFKDVNLRVHLNNNQKNLMESMLVDLDAEVVIDFNLDAFYEKISECIDGSKWRIKNNNEAKFENFGVSDFSTFFNFCSTYIKWFLCDKKTD